MALETTSDLIVVVDRSGRVTSTMGPSLVVTGYREEALSGRRVFGLVHPDDRGLFLDYLAKHLERPEAAQQLSRFRIMRPEGGWRHIAARAVNRRQDPRVGGVVLTLSDESDLQEALAALRLAGERHEAVLNALETAVLVVDDSGAVVSANPAAEELFGAARLDILADRPQGARVLDEEGREQAPARFPIRRALAAGKGELGEIVGLERDGQVRWLSVDTIVVGPLLAASFTDVTALREEAEAASRSARRFRHLAARSGTALLVCEADGTVRYASDRAVELFGPELLELDGLCFDDLVLGEDLGTFNAAFEAAVHRPERRHTVEFRGGRHRPDGSVTHFEARFANLLSDPEVAGVAITIDDVTERRQMAEVLAHQALHDPLTNLPNRSLFVDRLEHSLRRLQRGSGSVAVLFADVDRFKSINDGLGHSTGDRVLRTLAGRLRALLRPGDTVARFGGDEFVLLCEDTGPEAAMQIAQRITGLAEPVSRSVNPYGDLRVTLSVGVAVTSDPDTIPGALLANADAAMYRAKEEGRSRAVMFDSTMESAAQGRMDTEMALRRALSEHELRVVYQPVVRLGDRRLVGVEALLRWDNPRRGLLSPGEFISVAEDSGLIVPIGEWVFSEVCRQAVAWSGPGHPAPQVSVNVSARQLSDPDFLDSVRRELESSGLPAANLSVDVTENVLMADPDKTASVLAGLKEMGVTISLDDFGTGYSSLGYLRRFPVDAVKVDQTFVGGLGRDQEDSSVVSAILGLASSLGLATVAEGVETAEQAEALTAMGCTLAQGYQFGAPVSPEQLTEQLSATTQ